MTGRQAGRVAFAAVVVLSLVVLFIPASGVPTDVAVSDKLIHFLLFAALAVSGGWAALPVTHLLLRLVAYAGVSEVLQSALPIRRDGDVRDVLADSAGVVTGLAVVFLLRRGRVVRDGSVAEHPPCLGPGAPARRGGREEPRAPECNR